MYAFSHHIISKWWQLLHLLQVLLCLLHRLHTGVNGSHESLLGCTLITKLRIAIITHSSININYDSCKLMINQFVL